MVPLNVHVIESNMRRHDRVDGIELLENIALEGDAGLTLVRRSNLAFTARLASPSDTRWRRGLLLLGYEIEHFGIVTTALGPNTLLHKSAVLLLVRRIVDNIGSHLCRLFLFK